MNADSVDEIANRIRLSPTRLIAIDGMLGAGKSTLSEALSARLTIKTVHLDHYLEHECIGFSGHLQYDALQSALEHRPVIAEGVCMLEVLGRLGLRPDLFIYLDDPVGSKALDRDHPLVGEVIAYTEKFRPAEQADFVVLRPRIGVAHLSSQAEEHSILDACLTRNRSRFSRWLVAAGGIMLVIGALLVALGLSEQSQSTSRDGQGISPPLLAGLVTLVISSIWIFIARLSRPSMRVIRSSKPPD